MTGKTIPNRRYQSDGSLTPRSESDALIEDADEAADQLLDMVKNGSIRARDGKPVNVDAQTVCIHGDAPGAAQFRGR